MKKFTGIRKLIGGALMAMLLCSELASAQQTVTNLATFGLISDTHVCDKADQSKSIALVAAPRYFTGGPQKVAAFAESMNETGADFIAELGDFTDNPKDAKLPAEQRKTAALGFMETAEAKLALFKGPRYHVFGNHDTDQVGKEDFLSKVTNTGIDPKATYYSFDAKGLHIIVLDSSFKTDGASYSGVPGAPGSGYAWDDANIPAAELEWLKSDLAKAKSPVIVLTHQQLNNQELLDPAYDPKHTVRNAPEVRAILEGSKKVLAVFSGHYHDGGFQEINNIKYIVLQANAAYGNDATYHNQYSVVKVFAEGNNYTLALAGNGGQKSYSFSKVIN
jgi:alkaline phosphatase